MAADTGPEPLLDILGRRRSPATYPEFRRGKLPKNFGQTYPPEVLNPEEIFRIMDACDPSRPTDVRNRALIALLWRTGVRISEALALHERDLNVSTGIIRIRRGRNKTPRTIAMDVGGWQQLQPWLDLREELGIPADAPVFCVTDGPTRGRPARSAYFRTRFKELAVQAGVRKRVHPHAFRHTFAAELAYEGVPMHHIQRLIGHASLATTAVYLAGIAPAETIEVVRARPNPWETRQEAA